MHNCYIPFTIHILFTLTRFEPFFIIFSYLYSILSTIFLFIVVVDFCLTNLFNKMFAFATTHAKWFKVSTMQNKKNLYITQVYNIFFQSLNI